MINFHLPDASNNVSLLLSIAVKMKEHPELVRDDVKIGSVFGSPNVIWNGGRMILSKYDPAYTKNIIRQYNAFGVPYRFTWTNPLITEEYLNGYDANDLLDFANNGMNEVIVYSPYLEEHIRKKHPNMKITSSTCKCIREIEGVKEELSKPYSLVVLDFNFNNDFEKLEQLTPEERKRCEILCNPTCRPGCTRRAEHYRYIGEQQLHFREFLERFNRMSPAEKQRASIKEWECSDRQTFIYGEKDYPLVVKPETVYDKYVPMGFENFKLEGRAANMMLVAEWAARYIARPECKEEFLFHIMAAAIANYHMNMNVSAMH